MADDDAPRIIVEINASNIKSDPSQKRSVIPRSNSENPENNVPSKIMNSVPVILAIFVQKGEEIKAAAAYIPTISPEVVPLTPFSSIATGVYMKTCMTAMPVQNKDR